MKCAQGDGERGGEGRLLTRYEKERASSLVLQVENCLQLKRSVWLIDRGANKTGRRGQESS